MTDSEPVQLIHDRYEVVRTLGQGGFGRTLLVRDQTLDRFAAIKMLHPHRAESWKSYELFQREAAVLQSLRHYGVPEVYEVFRAPWEGVDAAFLVMEYVAGDSLAAVIGSQKHLDAADVVHLFQELLGVLDYLHGRVPPILHRDIKPANIIVRPNGFPALVDFGAVRSVIAPPAENGSTIVGTYGYMPYEQHMGQATPSSDLYALAATFLHLLTGRMPQEFMTGEGRLDVPESLPGGARFRAVLRRMLAPSPADRLQSAREVRQALLESSDISPALRPRRSQVPMIFSPAPRAIEGAAKDRFKALAPGAWQYLEGSDKPAEGIDVLGILGLTVLTFLTMGVLPLILGARAAARRSRLRHFFKWGVPAMAEITAIQDETIEFKLKLTRVRYEFEADGTIQRDVDEVFAAVANKWRPGDSVQILYLPDRNYDSLIVSLR